MKRNTMKDIQTKNHEQIQSKKKFILLRGLPGSGKSFLAKQLVGEQGKILSTDDFFIDEQGNYNWDVGQLDRAHHWTRERIKRALEQGVSPIILDNTNVSKWELRTLRPLVIYAEDQGYEVKIEQPTTPWAFDVKKLAEKNTHGLTEELIGKKLNKWYSDPTVEDIKNDFQPKDML